MLLKSNGDGPSFWWSGSSCWILSSGCHRNSLTTTQRHFHTIVNLSKILRLLWWMDREYLLWFSVQMKPLIRLWCVLGCRRWEIRASSWRCQSGWQQLWGLSKDDVVKEKVVLHQARLVIFTWSQSNEQCHWNNLVFIMVEPCIRVLGTLKIVVSVPSC